jgi:hypothetical protein
MMQEFSCFSNKYKILFTFKTQFNNNLITLEKSLTLNIQNTCKAVKKLSQFIIHN